MIARIAPFRRLPANLDFFDYKVPEELGNQIKVGSLVRIPFRHRPIYGLVLELVATSEQPHLEAIEAVFTTALTPQQLQLLQQLSNYYHQARSTLLSLFMPQPPVGGKELITALSDRPSLPPLITEAASLSNWCIYDDWQQLASVLKASLGTAKGQSLIIIPEYYLLPLVSSLTSTSLVMPRKQERKAFWQAWIESQTSPTIIGTFHSLFLPFTNLKQVIIIDSENPQFNRAEQNPRLHLADFLITYQHIYSCQMIFTSPSPNATVFQATRASSIPVKSIERKQSAIEIIDMTAERVSGTKSLLATSAQESISDSQKTLLYLNHYGTANMVACRLCNWVALCPRCQKSLSFNSSTRTLECWNCKQTESPMVTCPRCGSNQLKLRSSGLTRLVKEVREQWPEKKIALLSRRLTSSERSADIIIATSKIISTDLTFSLAVAVNPDNELWRADFTATEELRRHLRQILVRSDRLLIQTSTPEHYIYQSLGNFKSFISEELTFRQEFNYPPFANGYKIFIKDKKNPQQLLEELHQRLAAQPYINIITKSEKYLVVRGSLPEALVDSLIKTYNNRILIEINPYQWT